MPYKKLVKHSDPNNWTTEVILARDEDGNVTGSVRAGEPADMSADDWKTIESFGFIVEASSKEEAEQFAVAQPQVGSDIAGASPLLVEAPSETQPVSEPDKTK